MATSGMALCRLLAREKHKISSLPIHYLGNRRLVSSTFRGPLSFTRSYVANYRLSCTSYGQNLHDKCSSSSHVEPGRHLGLGLGAGWRSDCVTRASLRQLVPELRFNRDGKSGGNRRFRGMAFPAYAIAFSFFSKEKSELDEAYEKLKNVDALEMLLRRAKLSEQKKDWQDAENFYHEALALLNSRQQDKSWDEKQVIQAQVFIYDNMANLALSRGRLKESEVLYKETIKGLISSGRPRDDNAVIEISLKLAMIYAMQQRDKDAEAGYKFCMDTQEKKFLNADQVDDDTLGLMGMCINSYSRFLIIHGRVKEADAALRKTVGIAIKVLSEDHPQVAVLYSDLATTATMLNDFDAAKSHIDKALTIAGKIKSPDLATLWCNKGLICLERGEFSEAESACKKSLKFAKENNDKDMEKEATECLVDIRNKRKTAV